MPTYDSSVLCLQRGEGEDRSCFHCLNFKHLFECSVFMYPETHVLNLYFVIVLCMKDCRLCFFYFYFPSKIQPDVFALGRQGWGDHRRMENRNVVHRNHGVKYRTEGCIGTETMIVMLETSPFGHTAAPRRMYVLHPYGALRVVTV
jgi:hypothetical protein